MYRLSLTMLFAISGFAYASDMEVDTFAETLNDQEVQVTQAQFTQMVADYHLERGARGICSGINKSSELKWLKNNKNRKRHHVRQQNVRLLNLDDSNLQNILSDCMNKVKPASMHNSAIKS